MIHLFTDIIKHNRLCTQVGSGDEETTFITDDEEGSDIYLAGEGSGVEAGDDEDDDDEIDINCKQSLRPRKTRGVYLVKLGYPHIDMFLKKTTSSAS